ncbi:MAG TPA: hypothetical protein VIH86_07240, partial [Puia sp.]
MYISTPVEHGSIVDEGDNIKPKSKILIGPLCNIFLIILSGLFALELSARVLIAFIPWPMIQVNIQTPTIMAAKLNCFQNHQGPKIAVIGDSL